MSGGGIGDYRQAEHDLYFADSSQEDEEMNNPCFQVHKLNDEGIKKAEAIAGSFDELLRQLAFSCPEGREMAIVKTKLEEACFFAKKSMANAPENQL